MVEKILNLEWGFFSVVHIVSLLLIPLIIVGLYYILKNKSEKTKIIVLGVLSFSGIIAIIANLVMWGSPIEYLPFHLCSLTAMCLPFAVFSKNKILNNLLLLWSLGAVMALVVNSAQAEYKIFSSVFAIYYFPHMLEFGIPILMFKLGLVEKDKKCIKSTLGITFVAYTIIHLINIVINNYLVGVGSDIRVNYMYSVKPENPIFDLCYSLIPYSYWYLFLIIPIIVVYLLIIYIPEFKKQKALK